MASYYSLPIVISLILLLLRVLVHRHRAHSISRLPGPPPGPWLVGHLPHVLRPDNIADAEFAWTDKYGTALKIKGAFGADILFSADPKAMQYILNTAGYNFHSPKHAVASSRMTVGQGIIQAQGPDHVRHRKIMNPAFSISTLRGFVPMFQRTSQKTVAKWEEQIVQNGGRSIVLNIQSWLTRTTMDALGHAALDYDFGAIDETNNEHSAVYENLFPDTFFMRSDFAIVFEAMWGYLPLGMAAVIQLLPTKGLQRLRRYTTVATRVARHMVDNAQSDSTAKSGGKDLMSILIRANGSEDPTSRFSDNEVMAQLRTFMIAGQETTASTSTWALYELSRHREIQTRIRAEIKAARVHAAERGDDDLTAADLDAMKWLFAVIKETLRYHPIATTVLRESCREDVIPLSTPQTTDRGEVITSIPIRKGQNVMLSLAAYNRLKSVWGEDAGVWRPERFLEGREVNHKTGLGVISNLATFGSGIRSCIGWRFAVLEMQAILVEFLEHFEFSPAPGNPEIIRSATSLMTPMIKGQPGRGQLPLTVTSVTQENGKWL